MSRTKKKGAFVSHKRKGVIQIDVVVIVRHSQQIEGVAVDLLLMEA